jgi:hypothetical protein
MELILIAIAIGVAAFYAAGWALIKYRLMFAGTGAWAYMYEPDGWGRTMGRETKMCILIFLPMSLAFWAAVFTLEVAARVLFGRDG